MKTHPTRSLLIVAALLLTTFILALLLARRLAVFSPDDLILDAERTYALNTDIDRSLAAFAQSVTVNSDINGYALLIAEDVALDGSVAKDLTALGTTVDFSGTVVGDAVFMGERVHLDGTIMGETVIVAQTLDVAPGTELDGEVIACVEDAPAEMKSCDRRAAQTVIRRAGGQLASVWLVSLLNNPGALQALNLLLPLPVALVFTGIAALFAAVFPQPVRNIEIVLSKKPMRMLATGSMVALLVVGISAAYLVLLSYVPILAMLAAPFYLLGLVVFGLMLLTGWVTLAQVFGGWLARRLSRTRIAPLATTALGGLGLAFLAYGLSWLPLGDWAVLLGFFGLGLLGTGAVFVTRWGRRVMVFA